MYVTVKDFIKEWNRESMLTQKVLEGLTDESLKQKVYEGGRTLGIIAWHLTVNIPEYLAHFGLKIDKVENAENIPTSVEEIVNTFKHICSNAAKVIEEQWTDEGSFAKVKS